MMGKGKFDEDRVPEAIRNQEVVKTAQTYGKPGKTEEFISEFFRKRSHGKRNRSAILTTRMNVKETAALRTLANGAAQRRRRRTRESERE